MHACVFVVNEQNCNEQTVSVNICGLIFAATLHYMVEKKSSFWCLLSLRILSLYTLG